MIVTTRPWTRMGAAESDRLRRLAQPAGALLALALDGFDL